MTKEKKISIIIIVCFILILFPTVVFAEGIETYTVSFNSMGGSLVGDAEAESGAVIPKPEGPVLPGHIFAGWYKEEECINEWNFDTDTVTADTTLFAQWKDIYTISASSADASMGDVSGGGDYASGASVTLSAIPKDGYRFLQWAETGSADPVCSLVASVNTNLTAEFASIEIPSVTAVSSDYNSVTLSWNSLDYAAGYEIYRSNNQDGEFSLIYTAPSYDCLSFIDKGLETDKTYYYKVRAFCACETASTYGALTEPVSAITKVTAPSISAVSGGYRSLRVTWDAVPGATGYQIYRCSTQNGTFSRVCTLKFSEASGYTNYNLTSNKEYYYKVRAYRTAGRKTYYSDLSGIQSAKVSLVAPELNAASASETSILLTWNALPGVSGYELYRSTSQDGTYKKIYTATSAPTVIYTNKSLSNGAEYFYKIRAYGKQGSKKIYSAFSQPVSAVPSTVLSGRAFTILYQGDPQWEFSRTVRKKACLMCAYTITINNMGIEATPRTVYKSNGNTTCMSLKGLAGNFGVKPACAIDLSSPYLRSYTGFGTYIKSPSANGIAAIKEALNKHPEGVICYFKRGSRAHAIVASKYDGDTIYYSDPGRMRTTLLTFNNTWVRYHHRMTYRNLAYIVALDEINNQQ